MVSINLNRTLADDWFDYGNPEIRAVVRVIHDQICSSAPSGRNVVNYSLGGCEYHYLRIVRIEAHKDGRRELRHRTKAVLDEETEWSWWIFEGIMHEVPPLREQLGQTARAVFEQLDELYQYTTTDVSIDVDVATHELQAETSWVEVEDETDQLAAEIDALTETNQ